MLDKKLKIYIGGNIYGAGNIGDDSILYGILKILDNNQNFYTIGTLKASKLSGISDKNISFIDALDIKEVKKSIKKSDIFICGGGTMVGDELSLYFPILYLAELISWAKIYKKKVFLFCLGANKLKSKKAQKIVKKIYNLADVITLRDKGSLRTFENLGLVDKKFIITSDPAFVLKKQGTERSRELKNKILKENKKLFGVNMVNESWAELKDYKKTIAKACDYIYGKYGYKPVFFCNEIRQGEFYDYQANKETVSYLTSDYELLDPVYYLPSEMMDIISSFEFVIGMRMHVLLFSSLVNVPFVSVSRVDKVDNFMNSFNLKASGSINNLQLDKLIHDIEKVIRERDNLKQKIIAKIPELIKMTEINKNIFIGLANKENSPARFNFTSFKFASRNFFRSLKKSIKKYYD